MVTYGICIFWLVVLFCFILFLRQASLQQPRLAWNSQSFCLGLSIYIIFKLHTEFLGLGVLSQQGDRTEPHSIDFADAL